MLAVIDPQPPPTGPAPPPPSARDERVLVLLPTEHDTARMCDTLGKGGLACVGCWDLVHLSRELAGGAGVLLLTEEAISDDRTGLLPGALRGQPAWSAVPLVVLAREGQDTGHAQDLLTGVGANVTLLDRPVRVRTLLSVIQAALRTRRHQYDVRDALAERDRQAAALADSERQLSLIYNHTSDCLYLARVEPGERYTFLSVNETFLKVSGYARGQVVGRPMEAIVPAANHDLVRAKYREVIRTRRPLVYVETADLPAGRRYGEITLTPILGPDGGVTHLLGSIQDVTDRMVAEDRLRESEERAAFVRRSSGVGFWYCDLPFDVLHWDERVKAHFHLPPDARVTIDTFYDRLHPDDREPTRRAIERSIAERVAFDVDYRTVDPASGAEKWVRAIGRTFCDPDGTPRRFDGVTIDVTDRKRAEAWLQVVTDAVPALVSFVGRDLRYRFANRAYVDWFGLTPDQVVGKGLPELLGEKLFAHRRPYLAAALRGESVRFEGVTEHARLGTRHTEVTYTPHREGGEVAGFFVHVIDVTDRKRAEDALRESEGRFRALVTATADVVYRMGPDWGEMRHLVGREFIADTAEPSRTWLDTYIPPDDQPHVLAAIREAVRAKGIFQLEHRVNRVDGTLGWTLSRAIPILDERGGIVEWFGAASDVTRRKEAEQALLQSQAETERQRRLYEGVLTTTPDLAYVFDLDHRFVYANEGLLRMWGKTWDEAIGKTCLELGYEPWHAAMHDREIEEVKATGRPIRGEVPFTGTFGRRIYDYIFTPVLGPGGEVVAVAGTTRDVTDRKQMEDTLRGQTERLRLLWESASVLLTTDEPDAMMRGLFAKIAPHFGLDTYFNFMVDESGDALRLESCLGIPAETAREIRRLEFGQAVCGNVALHRRPISATFIQESDDPKVQLVKSFGIRAYACNPLLAGDRLLGTLSFASRTRDQFDADELEFLATITRYATVAYERLRLVKELRATDRRKDEFLALLAHELRNPLAPLRNGLQVMRLAGDNPDAVARSRAMMDRQLAHMVRLIDDLLDVSRINRNKMELRRSRVLLSDVIASAVETARPQIEAGRHELTVSLPPEPVYLDADLTRLAQVFANLLTNSAKYTEAGGRIWLTAERREVRGEESGVRDSVSHAPPLTHPSSLVEVAVGDTGIGIPRESLPNIFDMFSQVDRSLERTAGGLGIGLALVKGLVEMHGGTVTAASDGPGTGTTFTVRLPAPAEEPERLPVVPPDANGHAAGPPRRMLVVDDNRDSAGSMATMLRLLGHEVATAHDGVEAVAAAAAFRPDVILMDVGMPRLNGLEATRQIRERPGGREPTIIALTGWGQDADRARTREAGCDGHLVKPVSLSDLQKLLAELTGGGRAADG